MTRIPLSAVDRRGFLGALTLTVGGIAASGLLSPSLLQVDTPGLACSPPDACGDWQLDDICNSYPPYAFHVDAALAPPQLLAHHAAADWHWVA